MQPLTSIPNHLKNQPYLYRVKLLDRFYGILDNQELVFVNPSLWEDPLENIIFNAKITKNGKAFINPIQNRMFAQCWSMDGDSYALWQIFTTKANDQGIVKRHMGVRITTHLDRLQQLSQANDGLFSFGLVDYMSKTRLDNYAKKPVVKDILKKTEPNIEHAKTLLVKRKNYAYEQEVRLINIDTDSSEGLQKIKRLRIDPRKFISSVRFDPQMDYETFQKHKQRLVSEYGFKRSQITRSTYLNENEYSIDVG